MTYGVNAPLGAVPVSYLGGSTYINNTQTIQMGTTANVSNNTASSIFQGDLVGWDTTGSLIRYVPGTTTVLGVFAGCRYTDPTNVVQFSNYLPQSLIVAPGTPIYCQVYTDPNNVFDLQIGVASTGIPYGFIGSNVQVSFATAGNTLTGQSGMVMDASVVQAITNTLPLMFLGFTPVPGNAPAYGGTSIPYANVLVKLNNAALGTGNGQVGI